MRIERGVQRLVGALELDCGRQLLNPRIAYEAYGSPNPDASNAVLVCHGLTTTQHAAGLSPVDAGRAGWWDTAIGPGKAIDTSRYWVVCSNVLGGFGGSTGPGTPEPTTGRPYGMRFPLVTVADMVRAQRRLADTLGIARFRAVVGGCLGGFQVLEWLRQAPARVGAAVVISAGPWVSAHTIALWRVLSEAIRMDPAWRDGDYYGHAPPSAGMRLATRVGALFWMTRGEMERRFARRRVSGPGLSYGFDRDFEVEAFLGRVGTGAAERIDANSFLYLMRAMSYFDLGREAGLDRVFKDVDCPVLLVSYASDWRYPPEETALLARPLRAAGSTVWHHVLDSPFGHGAFVYDFKGLGPLLRAFIEDGAPATAASLSAGGSASSSRG